MTLEERRKREIEQRRETVINVAEPISKPILCRDVSCNVGGKTA